MKLSKEEIKAIIPHRDPMLLVDTVEEMEAGCGATSFLRNSDKIYEKKEMLLRRKSKLKHPQLSIWIAGGFFAQIHL